MNDSLVLDLMKYYIGDEDGIEWNKWINRFDNFLIALDVTEDSRQKALLLFYAGTDVHSIYNTLVNPSDEVDYAAAKTKLASYFAPSKNETFEVYNFRSLQQLGNEPIDTYITRLREAGSRCGFIDPDKEIKHQVVFSCESMKIRRKALSEDPTLDNLIKFARSLEKTTTQAKIMENQRTTPPPHVHKISKPGKYSNRHTARRPREDSGCSNQTKPEGKSCKLTLNSSNDKSFLATTGKEFL